MELMCFPRSKTLAEILSKNNVFLKRLYQFLSLVPCATVEHKISSGCIELALQIEGF